ncbi:MAG: hypothetical protein DRJ49_06200 [Thermoprotei archaeon]|nr:MAG: hypothetical protein DRJ49_06200 [Thermoprotei archaeon]
MRTAKTYQGRTRTFPLSLAYTYVWYSNISIEVNYPWRVITSISVPIGVIKMSQLYAYLKVEVQIIGGDYIVRSYDIKGGWLKSYHIWESPQVIVRSCDFRVKFCFNSTAPSYLHELSEKSYCNKEV